MRKTQNFQYFSMTRTRNERSIFMRICLPIITGLLTTTTALFGALAEANLDDGTLTYGDYNVRNIKLAPGFKLELMHMVAPNQVAGGWVSIAADPKGRLFTSSRDQRGRIYRLTVPPPGVKGETKVELVDLDVGSADGL